jgi:hypothetical protein
MKILSCEKFEIEKEKIKTERKKNIKFSLILLFMREKQRNS